MSLAGLSASERRGSRALCSYSSCRQTPECHYYAFWLDDNQRRCALYSSCNQTEAVTGSMTGKTIRSCVARLLVEKLLEGRRAGGRGF